MTDDIKRLKLIAWVGPDEYTDELGLKQAILAGEGRLPLVAREKKAWVLEPEFHAAMQAQASLYGKPIYLVRYAIEDIIEIKRPKHTQQ